MKRPLRRVALLQFPGVSCSRDYIQQLKEEGFTDVGLNYEIGLSQFTGAGYNMDQTRQTAEWLEEVGMKMVVFTGYQKYQEPVLRDHPERGMICIGGSGVTRDSDSVVTSTWLCPFQPDNKTEYLSLLTKLIELNSLREIHLNDEAGLGFSNGSFGCYCSFCVSEYESEFGQPPPQKPNWKSQEWWTWIQYRMKKWTDIHTYFRSEIKKKRPDMVVGIAYSPTAVSYSQEPWVAGIDLSQDAKAMDVMCTDPYHNIHYPLFTYRPTRRIVTEATRSFAGATFNTPMNIYPQGFAPPMSSLEMTHRDGFMAGSIPYALGAETVTPYSYDLMKIIPGYFDGFQQAEILKPYFEKTVPYAYISAINPFQTELFGYPDEGWGGKVPALWPDVMNQVGLPWKWIFDRRLPDARNHLGDVSIMPDSHCLTREQRKVLEDYTKSGKGLLWVGRYPTEDWTGQGGSPPPDGETIPDPELKPVQSGHPLLNGIDVPIFLESAFLEPSIDGETIAEVEGRPALVVKQTPNGREAWLAGIPKFNYVTHGNHSGVRTPTGGINLLRNLLIWLAEGEPMARLWPYPPENAYGTLRPWDRRDIPTMELFPMLGDRLLVCLIFNYVGLSYRTNLVMRTPEGNLPQTLTNIYTKENLLADASVDGQQVTLPVEMSSDTEYLAVELTW